MNYVSRKPCGDGGLMKASLCEYMKASCGVSVVINLVVVAKLTPFTTRRV